MLMNEESGTFAGRMVGILFDVMSVLYEDSTTGLLEDDISEDEGDDDEEEEVVVATIWNR